MTKTATTTKITDTAILTVDGQIVAQAKLAEAFHLDTLKAHARQLQAAGHTVTLKKGVALDEIKLTCGVCGRKDAFRLTFTRINMDGHDGQCHCGAKIGGSNTYTGLVTSWMSAAEIAAANEWYDEQLFGFDGGF